MSDSDKKQGFTVHDRRSRPEDGEARPSADADEASTNQPDPSSEQMGEQVREQVRARDLPPADFSTFVLSLGSSTLIHLGQVEAPGEGGRQRDLPMAKHTIDLLSLLREKTKNNLSQEEDELLESMLYDLRLRYVEAVKAGS